MPLRFLRLLPSHVLGLLLVGTSLLTTHAQNYPAWVEGSTYKTGDVVTYGGSLYQALVYQTDWAGAGWNPAASPTLWKKLGTTSSNPTPDPAPTPTPVPSGGCAALWVATKAYTGGAAVSYNHVNYRANWWTQGNVPATSNGKAGTGQPWTIVSTCGDPLPPDPPKPNPPTPDPPTPDPPTPNPPQPSSGTSGTINFHLLLGVGAAQDSLKLDGDNYTDLVMSNIIAGVMTGHLIQENTPGILFQKDYLYGSILGQLLQENIETQLYKSSSDLLDPSPDQAAVMGAGQGGPYQINNYAADMVSGGYAPAGHSLINYITVQKNIGYTMGAAASQYTQPTPASFNNKYYGPILTAYFHYNDYVALGLIGKGDGGWMTPWQPDFDKAIANFKNLPNNFLDVLLNVAYNQGFYGPLMSKYSKLGATATASTVSSVNSYASTWGSQDTYQQYPYQVRYYLDQVYDNPVPTTNPQTTTTPQNHVVFSLAKLNDVFANVFATLSYVDSTGKLSFIPASQSQTAFNAALTQAGLSPNSSLDLSNALDRAKIFSVLESAITRLETNLGTSFIATSTK